MSWSRTAGGLEVSVYEPIMIGKWSLSKTDGNVFHSKYSDIDGLQRERSIAVSLVGLGWVGAPLFSTMSSLEVMKVSIILPLASAV